MEQIKQAINQMISVSEEELNEFLGKAITQNFKRQEILSYPEAVPNDFFIPSP